MMKSGVVPSQRSRAHPPAPKMAGVIAISKARANPSPNPLYVSRRSRNSTLSPLDRPGEGACERKRNLRDPQEEPQIAQAGEDTNRPRPAVASGTPRRPPVGSPRP